MRYILAIILGKLISSLTKLLKIGGGSAAPGYFALKICPDILDKLSLKIPKSVIITGTNGKTTTARLLNHFVENQGTKVIRNSTGSNMERGLVSALLNNVGHHFDLAIWELDEAAFNNLAPRLKPEVIVFLNVFRDQLDRYGEIDSVVKNWSKTLQKLPQDTKILINGDDPNLGLLKSKLKTKVKTFGVKGYAIEGEKVIQKEEIGNLDFEAENVKTQGLLGSTFEVITSDSRNKQSLKSSPDESGSHYKVDLPLPGIYHIYDFLAAFMTGLELGVALDRMIVSLEKFSPAFGRVEKINLSKSQQGYIFLIKNPVGATQVFQTIKNEITPDDRLLLALNDNLADGTDVSWIWDAQFELLLNQSQTKSESFSIVTSGTRASDLALRLKYAGFDSNSIKIETSLKKALRQAQQALKGRLFILPTYSALLELEKILASAGLKPDYWKEGQL